jgi:hypothetical protein
VHKEFADRYARAKEIQADVMSEELLDIVDDGTNDWTTKTFGHTEIEVVNQEAVQRSKLRYEARRWLMGKMKPKKYGDKMDLNVSGELTLADRIQKARQARDGSGG